MSKEFNFDQNGAITAVIPGEGSDLYLAEAGIPWKRIANVVLAVSAGGGIILSGTACSPTEKVSAQSSGWSVSSDKVASRNINYDPSPITSQKLGTSFETETDEGWCNFTGGELREVDGVSGGQVTVIITDSSGNFLTEGDEKPLGSALKGDCIIFPKAQK